jgi:ADP-ribose pyrophosphatase
MEILKTETIFNGKYLKMKRKHFKTKNGKKEVWECVERKIASPVFVAIFALTKNKEVILEKNYRVPLEGWVIELPAGLCDKKGESEIETARRELLEETGYKAKKLIPIFKSPVNSGITNEEVRFYFAAEATLVSKPLTEDTEEIEVIKIPLNKLLDFILNPSKNTKSDIKILSILPILKKKKLI